MELTWIHHSPEETATIDATERVRGEDRVLPTTEMADPVVRMAMLMPTHPAEATATVSARIVTRGGSAGEAIEAKGSGTGIGAAGVGEKTKTGATAAQTGT
jgi:hypothetical protein